ncbi:hypothetical protein BDQ17DRAFT_1545012 [Cyathus striatus]|nr:hypothetical protein BDQ17DRAFT_1545012 [Cyathus striatus]
MKHPYPTGEASSFTLTSCSSSSSSSGIAQIKPGSWLTKAGKKRKSTSCQEFLEIILPEFNSSSFSFTKSLSPRVQRAIRDHLTQYSDLNTHLRRTVLLAILRAIAADSRVSFCQEEPGYVVGLCSNNFNHSDDNGYFPGLEPLFFLVVEDREDKTLSEELKDALQSSPRGFHAERSCETLNDSSTGFSKVKQAICTNYASRLLLHDIPRRHAIGICMSNDKLYMLYYDHSIVITSEPLDWLADVETFARVIHTISHLNCSRMGFETSILSSVPHPIPAKLEHLPTGNREMSLMLNLDVFKVLLLDPIYWRREVIGRGSLLVRAQLLSSDNNQHRTVVVKFGYIPTSKFRSHEADTIRAAREKAGSSINSRNFLKNLPDLIASKVVPPSALQERIFRALGDTYERRALEITVVEELYPVTKLTNDVDMLKAFRDIFECHYWLYAEMKLLHRDISTGNIMYRKEGNTLHGVLNDFDRAVFLDDVNSETALHQRVGTLPFIAFDLLRNSQSLHLYRHDLESLFNVFRFIITHRGNGKQVLNSKSMSGPRLDPESLLVKRVRCIIYSQPINPTSNFIRMKGLAEEMWNAIRKGYIHMSLGNVDYETLGDRVTYSSFLAMFDNAKRSVEARSDRSPDHHEV